MQTDFKPLTPTAPLARKTVLIVVNKDGYFLSHRLPLAQALKDAGASIIVAAGDTGRGPEIESLGFTFTPISFDRGGVNPFREIRTLLDIYRTIQRLKPDVVHNIAIKSTLYGTLAALAAGHRVIINTIAGLGFLFTASTGMARFIRFIVSPLFRIGGASKSVHFIFFNEDDQRTFCNYGFADVSRSTVIAGSGVDVSAFEIADPLREPPTIVMCSRLLLDKGLRELVAAVKILRLEGLTFRVIVAGERDSGNPRVVSEEELAGWVKDGLIEAPGFIKDTKTLLSNASIAVLPSFYGEGIPLFLLEALAAGLPVVTTDVPGCRATVIPGENGELVPARDPESLAAALRSLITDAGKRARFGKASRRIAVEWFEKEIVNNHTIALYEERLVAQSTRQ